MRRLQLFLRAVMKRRTKEILKQDGALTFGGKAAADKGREAQFNIVERKVESVVVDFTAEERWFYDRLAAKANFSIDRMIKNQKIDSISALVLLLRLRQACNHPQLTRTGVSKDRDALAGSSSTPATRSQMSGGGDIDDIASLLGGLSVTTKQCDICKEDLLQEEIRSGQIRCDECEDNLVLVRVHGSKKADRSRSKWEIEKRRAEERERERERGVTSGSDLDAQMQKLAIGAGTRDEEGEGEWIVPEKERKTGDLGRAGGSEDENADGGGDSLGSEDSDTADEEEEEGDRSTRDTSATQASTDSASSTDGNQKDKSTREVIEISDDQPPHIISSDDDDDDDDDDDKEAELLPSAKIKSLLEILRKETPEHKVIIFSVFTSMLDIIEPMLADEGIVSVRYDGKLRNDVREANLNKLRHDESTRVLLCSLKCGSLGLNLTAASRVVILEPFWNPVSFLNFSFTVIRLLLRMYRF